MFLKFCNLESDEQYAELLYSLKMGADGLTVGALEVFSLTFPLTFTFNLISKNKDTDIYLTSFCVCFLCFLYCVLAIMCFIYVRTHNIDFWVCTATSN